MKSQYLKKIVSKFPDTPGVYKFLRGNKIIYIGKATSLRDRVRSYFNKDVVNTRGPLISKMLEKFDKVEYIKTDSVLEALILEAHLIKKYQPEAHTIDKDNKSFNFVVITREDYPRVLIVRQRELENNFAEEISHRFGPFTNGGQLKEALKLIRKMFPFRDKCVPLLGKPCFNKQIGLCPGVCTGEISKQEYRKIIRNIVLFFGGNKKQIAKNLEKQMKGFAKKREFEKANITKRTLFALDHIRDVSLLKHNSSTWQADELVRIESYDVAHMSGKDMVGVMTVVENGEVKKSDYRKFKIKTIVGSNDTGALSEMLERRLGHIEWRMPDLIVVDGGTAQKNIIEKILTRNNLKIPVVSVVKDEKHKAKEILGDKQWLKYENEILLSNSEAHRFAIGYHKRIRGKL